MFRTIPILVNGADYWICGKCRGHISLIRDIYTLDIAEGWNRTDDAYPKRIIIIVCMACKESG